MPISERHEKALTPEASISRTVPERKLGAVARGWFPSRSEIAIHLRQGDGTAPKALAHLGISPFRRVFVAGATWETSSFPYKIQKTARTIEARSYKAG
jgi:hypothetical protein